MHCCPRGPKDPARQGSSLWQPQPCPLGSASRLAMENSTGHGAPHMTDFILSSICVGSSLRHSTRSTISSSLPLLGLGPSWLPGFCLPKNPTQYPRGEGSHQHSQTQCGVRPTDSRLQESPGQGGADRHRTCSPDVTPWDRKLEQCD